MGKFWLILKVDLMGCADGSDVGVRRCFVLSKWVDRIALIRDVGRSRFGGMVGAGWPC